MWNKRILVFIVLCIISFAMSVTALEFSHRIQIQGFYNAKVGYEFDVNQVHLKTLLSGDIFGEEYYNLDIETHLGKIWYNEKVDVEFVCAVGVDVKSSFKVNNEDINQEVYSIVPSLNLTMYKHFNKCFVGGCFALDTWLFQKIGKKNQSTGWNGIRKITLNPEFILGYDFNFKK